MRSQEIVIEVAGMSAADSESAVAASLKRVPGVQSVQVNASEGRAVVTGDPDLAQPDALREAIRKAGYVAGEIWFAE